MIPYSCFGQIYNIYGAFYFLNFVIARNCILLPVLASVGLYHHVSNEVPDVKIGRA
jgi:hypothetical protein